MPCSPVYILFLHFFLLSFELHPLPCCWWLPRETTSSSTRWFDCLGLCEYYHGYCLFHERAQVCTQIPMTEDGFKFLNITWWFHCFLNYTNCDACCYCSKSRCGCVWSDLQRSRKINIDWSVAVSKLKFHGSDIKIRKVPLSEFYFVWCPIICFHHHMLPFQHQTQDSSGSRLSDEHSGPLTICVSSWWNPLIWIQK